MESMADMHGWPFSTRGREIDQMTGVGKFFRLRQKIFSSGNISQSI